MTKYEWETELKKNIHRLPADEIKRVMEYYAELFEDHVERGQTESQIINEFGNPVDVADKILSEYDGELTDDVKTPPTPGAADNAWAPKTHGSDDPTPILDASENSTGHKNIEPINEPVEEKRDVQDNVSDGAAENVRKKPRPTVGGAFKCIGLVLLGIFAVVALVGGAYVTVVSFGVMAHNFGSGIVHLGIGLVTVGIGVLIGLPIIKYFEGKGMFANNTASSEVDHENKN